MCCDKTLRPCDSLVCCCSFSIHARNKEAAEWRAVLEALPLPVPGMRNVFHLVLAAASSYGAISYLIRRPKGNIMMDSPRYDARLLKRIQVLTASPPSSASAVVQIVLAVVSDKAAAGVLDSLPLASLLERSTSATRSWPHPAWPKQTFLLLESIPASR